MDKSTLLNEISKLRSLVKTARINIIKKLVRDHKFWTSKAVNNSGNQRAKKKAESSETILKHVQSHTVPVLIEELLRYRPAKNGQPAESGSIANRTMARFCADTKLSSHLKALAAQYGEGENSALLVALEKRKAIKSSLNKKHRREKKAKMLEKKKELERDTKQKDASVAKAKTKKALKGNPLQEKEPDEQQMDHDLSDDSDGHDLEVQSDYSISVSEDDNSASEDEADHENAVITERKSDKHMDAKGRFRDDSNTSSNVSKPTLPLVVQKAKTAPKKKATNYKPPEEDDEGFEMITDSFFLTDSGANYVSVAPKVTKEANAEDEEEEDEEEESWKFANKRKKREQRNRNEGNDEYDTESKPSKGTKLRKVNEGTRIHPVRATPKEDIHPSWAAKQAQKGLKPFAGKKVIFDEEDAGKSTTIKHESTSDLHPSWAAKQAQKGIKPFAGKKVIFDSEDASENHTTVAQNSFKSTSNSDLHPSWVAKQAQKGIKPFAGKKVVFDSEDASENHTTVANNSFKNTSNSDLHPSWIAKQAQKGIKPFAGKKVVFDTENETNDRVASVNRSSSFNGNSSKDNIHPSWAPKQAQRGIVSFAGKKTKLDVEAEPEQYAPENGNHSVRSDDRAKNGSRYSQSVLQPDLHPSWAAKQAKSGIKQFAGTKISFDDE